MGGNTECHRLVASKEHRLQMVMMKSAVRMRLDFQFHGYWSVFYLAERRDDMSFDLSVAIWAVIIFLVSIVGLTALAMYAGGKKLWQYFSNTEVEEGGGT